MSTSATPRTAAADVAHAALVPPPGTGDSGDVEGLAGQLGDLPAALRVAAEACGSATSRPAIASPRPVKRARLQANRDVLDVESREWVRALSGTGPERNDAIERLHALLLRATRFEINRRRAATGVDSGSPDDLATQAANDALLAITSKLHTFRGDSRFTTWAYKFALLEAGVKLRRRPWQEREIPLEEDGWALLHDDSGASPRGHAESAALIEAVSDAITEVLTPHQRAVLVAITLNDVPIDVLAERRNTTRGALYKTLHVARRKLRARLAKDGFALDHADARAA